MLYLSPKKELEKDARNYWNDLFTPFLPTNDLMKTDVSENEKNYVFTVDLPGYDKKNIKISLDDGYLTLAAEKKSETETKEKNFLRKERFEGQTSRCFYVGNVDEKLINASYENGVLTVNVPKEEKPEEDKTNYISID
jgi:HSP20 family molecular chaperone IbpA